MYIAQSIQNVFLARGVMSQHYVYKDFEWIESESFIHRDSILIVQVLLDAQKAELPRAEREAKETSQCLSSVHYIPAFLVVQDVWMLKA